METNKWGQFFQQHNDRIEAARVAAYEAKKAKERKNNESELNIGNIISSAGPAFLSTLQATGNPVAAAAAAVISGATAKKGKNNFQPIESAIQGQGIASTLSGAKMPAVEGARVSPDFVGPTAPNMFDPSNLGRGIGAITQRFNPTEGDGLRNMGTLLSSMKSPEGAMSSMVANAEHQQTKKKAYYLSKLSDVGTEAELNNLTSAYKTDKTLEPSTQAVLLKEFAIFRKGFNDAKAEEAKELKKQKAELTKLQEASRLRLEEIVRTGQQQRLTDAAKPRGTDKGNAKKEEADYNESLYSQANQKVKSLLIKNNPTGFLLDFDQFKKDLELAIEAYSLQPIKQSAKDKIINIFNNAIKRNMPKEKRRFFQRS